MSDLRALVEIVACAIERLADNLDAASRCATCQQGQSDEVALSIAGDRAAAAVALEQLRAELHAGGDNYRMANAEIRLLRNPQALPSIVGDLSSGPTMRQWAAAWRMSVAS